MGRIMDALRRKPSVRERIDWYVRSARHAERVSTTHAEHERQTLAQWQRAERRQRRSGDATRDALARR